jgi:lactoylglutathione lyase
MTMIRHVAIWVKDLETIRRFYQYYFDAASGEKYTNPSKKFTSCILSFKNGSDLEIMHRPDIQPNKNRDEEYLGWAHIAIGVGSREKVLELTESIRKGGYEVIGEPRMTGDGFFESVVLDPEDNRIEITI